MVRQADDIPAVYKILKFANFNSEACLGYWNEFIVLMALY